MTSLHRCSKRQSASPDRLPARDPKIVARVNSHSFRPDPASTPEDNIPLLAQALPKCAESSGQQHGTPTVRKAVPESMKPSSRLAARNSTRLGAFARNRRWYILASRRAKASVAITRTRVMVTATHVNRAGFGVLDRSTMKLTDGWAYAVARFCDANG
jgi:hypothetical protein